MVKLFLTKKCLFSRGDAEGKCGVNRYVKSLLPIINCEIM